VKRTLVLAREVFYVERESAVKERAVKGAKARRRKMMMTARKRIRRRMRRKTADLRRQTMRSAEISGS
jgi:hypothetical protein